MKSENLAIEPILVPVEEVEKKSQPDQWVQEEEKLRNERSRWEEQRAFDRLQQLMPTLDFRKLIL